MTSRYRSTGGLTPSVYTYGSQNSDGSYNAPGTTTIAATNGTWTQMWDEVDGDFFKRQKAGILTVRSMTKAVDQCVPGSGDGDVVFSNGSRHFGSGAVLPVCLGGYSARYLDDTSSLIAAAVKAKSGVVPSTTLSAVSAYELEKTVEMFVKAGTRVKRFIPNLLNELAKRNAKRRKQGKQELRALDVASSLWLEHRYGWLPLMYDIKGHIDAFERNDQQFWRKSYGNDTSTGRYQDSGSWTYGSGFTSGFTWSDTHNQVTKVRCGIYYIDTLDYERRVASNLGLDLWSSSQIVWEVIPFSFVVDWFINVGNWLEAIKPKPGVKTLAEWTTIEQWSVATRAITGQISVGCTSNWSSTPQIHDRYKKVRFPSISFPYYPPRGSGVNSLIREVSAASLGWQQLRNILKKL